MRVVGLVNKDISLYLIDFIDKKQSITYAEMKG